MLWPVFDKNTYLSSINNNLFCIFYCRELNNHTTLLISSLWTRTMRTCIRRTLITSCYGEVNTWKKCGPVIISKITKQKHATSLSIIQHTSAKRWILNSDVHHLRWNVKQAANLFHSSHFGSFIILFPENFCKIEVEPSKLHYQSLIFLYDF